MAFNIVDNSEKHRGIILGRYGLDNEIVKTESRVLWLCGFTDYQIEDLGWDLERIKKMWADRWQLKGEYGGYDVNRFNKRIEKMIKVHKQDHLNSEEKLRFMHTWHSWRKLRDEIENRIPIQGYVLIDPLRSEYRDNKIIVSLPESYLDPVDTDYGLPVFFSIISPPRLKQEMIHHEGVRIAKYSTRFEVVSGNTQMTLSLPFPISNARSGDLLQLYFDQGDLALIFVNGLFYEMVRKRWSLFS